MSPPWPVVTPRGHEGSGPRPVQRQCRLAFAPLVDAVGDTLEPTVDAGSVRSILFHEVEECERQHRAGERLLRSFLGEVAYLMRR
jgi:hypothetical protein